MKKKSLLFFLLSLITLTNSAQKFVVEGIVFDTKTKQAVEMASAVLLKPDSSIVGGVKTNEAGHFALKVPQAGNYIVKASFVGYASAYKNVRLNAGKDTLNIGYLGLEPDAKALKEAVVTATVAKVEQKEDTTMFNAGAYRTPEGSTLEALIKQLPGVEVDDDGKIKVHGKEVKELLVNGKDFFKGDNDVAMKNLPVDLVSKIKAYDKASDYTEQTGIDDGEESTVLDIMTKRELNESWISNVDLGYGTEERYTGKIFLTRFTDRTRVTAYGSANNVNDMGFGGPRGFGGWGGGLTARKDAGLDFSWENNKAKKEAGRLELGGNVRYSHTGTDAISTSSSETFLTGGSKSSFSNSRTMNGSSSTRINSSFRLQWKPDTMTTITFRPSYTHSSSDNAGNSSTATFNDDPYEIPGMISPLDSILLETASINPALAAIAVNTNQRFSLGSSESNSVNGTLNLTRRFNSLGRNLSVRLSGGYSKSESESFSISDIKYFNQTAPRFLNQFSNTPSKNWNYSARLSYAEPITKNLFAEVRYDYGFRYTDSDRSRYNLDSLAYSPYSELWPDYVAFGNPDAYPAIGCVPTEAEVLDAVRDLNNSQYATYKYYNHTANLGIRYNTEKIRFNVGVDFKPERTKMAYNRPGQIDTTVVRNVFTVSPQLRFRYRFSKTNNFDFRYRGSSSQPSMTNLLNVIDNADPLNVSMGNPGLKPSWTNSIQAHYRGYNAEKQQGIMGSISMSQTNNSISNMMVYDESTGVRYTRPENINGNWDARGHFMFNTGFGPDKNFTVMTFTNLSYDNRVGYIRSVESGNRSSRSPILVASAANNYYDEIFSNSGAQKNTTKTTGVGERLSLNYRNSWFDVGVFGNVNYQHSRATLQNNNNMDTWNFAYGASGNVNFDWGMSISTDLRMSSRRGYSDATMNTNELLWNAQIAQSFLRNRAATISVQFYDILKEQSNVSRSISAMHRSDSWNNAIHSYVMVHFIYKLNIFGGSAKGKDKKNDRPKMMPRGGGPGGGGMPMMRIWH